MLTETPNLNYIHELSGGDSEFEGQMIAILKQELPTEVDTYNNSIKNQNFKQSAEIVHKIKHKISILGLEKSYDFSVAYEKELLKGSMEKHTDFLSILNNMSTFLDQL